MSNDERGEGATVSADHDEQLSPEQMAGSRSASAQEKLEEKESVRSGSRLPLIQGLMRGVIETGADVLGATLGQELRRELEARGLSTSDLIKRTLEQGVNKGVEVLDQTEELRRSLPINPSELVERVSHKVDSYKAEGIEIARAELRRFLDRIDLNQELQALLSQFSVEVKTEIRFAPSEDGSGVKPIVKTSAQVKRDPDAKTRDQKS